MSFIFSQNFQTLTPTRNLRSTLDNRIFTPPFVRTKTYGNRSFSYQAISIWNSLPYDIRHSPAVSVFKSKLKSHLFSN